MMDKMEESLKIPEKASRSVSASRYVCIVPDVWIRSLQNFRYEDISPSAYSTITDSELSRLLAPSTAKVCKPWERISVKTFMKGTDTVRSLVDKPLCRMDEGLTSAELYVAVSKINRRNIAFQARRKYDAAVWPEEVLEEKPILGDCSSVIRRALERLFCCQVLVINQSTLGTKKGLSSEQRDIGYDYCRDNKYSTSPAHPNVSQVYAILESSNAFHVIQPFVQFTLCDAVMFTSNKLNNSCTKQLFLIYQILQAMKFCHSRGISVGELRLSDIFTDEKLWLWLNVPSVKNVYEDIGPEAVIGEGPKSQQTVIQPGFSQSAGVMSRHQCNLSSDLPCIVQKWVHGEISNFDYLMILNHYAGRNGSDPNHHPVLPWVTDFTSPNGRCRDLTKSQYRLTKGDRQLDLTYNISDPEALNDPYHIPHHVSEVLSDITYYVYMARRTDKPLLCAHVRSKWVPHEYPSTMQRLQEWTPDECIPEFFTDPNIFTSIHEDLPDLGIPDWCDSPTDFIEQHMAVLEGEYVSARLHHWIDLTFGFKLSGTAAVSAKNVCLQIADQHTFLSNHGVVQIFDHPHPPKLTKIPSIMTLRGPQLALKKKSKDSVPVKRDERRPRTTAAPRGTAVEDPAIKLPQGYNPLQAMEQLEALMDFTAKVSKKLPPPRNKKVPPKQDPRTSLVARDMQALGCLIMEISMPKKFRAISPAADLDQRYELVRGIYQNHYNNLPRPIRHPVYILLNLSKTWDKEQIDDYGSLFHYDVLSGDGLPPPSVDILLHPALTPIPFPKHVPGFYSLVHKLRLIEQTLVKLTAKDSISSTEKQNQIRLLAKQKVTITAQYLGRMACHVGVDLLDILMPYIVDLFEDPLTSAQAAWSLFNPLATALGPAGTESHFLSLLLKLFDVEETTPKFMKIYHRSYIMQVVVRLGMDIFLTNFSTLLIEAAAGYKNFHGEDYVDRLISNETEEMQYPGVFVNEGFEDSQPQTFGNSCQGAMFEDNMSLEDEDHLKAPADLDAASNGSGSLGNTSQEDVHESQSSGTKSSTVDMEDGADSGSINSEEVSDDILGKSLGRLSVHSVSRLMEEDKLQQNSSSTDVADECDQLESKENGFYPPKGEEEDATDGVSDKEQIRLVVRHDTEDFTKTLMNPVGDVEYNISDVAAETIKWLAHRIGPVLTAKHLSRNLLRMLALCYLGEEQLEPVVRDTLYGEELSATKRYVLGDNHATQILECLSCIVILYGEHVILLQYFQHIKELVSLAGKRMAARIEAGLISCLTLLIYIIPYLTDSTLMDNLQDTLFKDMLLPVLKVVSSNHVSFPTGSRGRSIICYKLIDVLYIISLRIGFEMTREHMTFVLQKFFAAFSRVHDKIEEDTEPKKDSPQSPVRRGQQDGAAAKTEDQESIYFEIKRDTHTHEYKVGTAIPVDESGSPSAVSSPSKGHRRQSSLGSLKHSLSPTKDYLPEEVPTNQNKPLIQRELKETFTPALAHAAYIPFCKLAGGIHMEQHLINDDLIRQLCTDHDLAVARDNSPILEGLMESDAGTLNGKEPPKSPFEETGEVSGSFGRNVSVEGNKIMIQEDSKSLAAPPGEQVRVRRRSGGSTVDGNKLRSPEMKMNTQRHLKGNWLAYWEHEVGMTDRDSAFNFKQIKLQTFAGHTSSVRAFSCLDNENSFISASKDKTVKLWSLRSLGDGSTKVGPQWTYVNHRKSVFAVSFLESVRYVASCDSNIHIWDPFIGMSIRQWESPKNSPISVVVPMPAPNAALITASSDSVLRFLDIRKGTFCQEFKCTTSPAGLIRSVTVSPDGKCVAVGFSSGVISTLDLRTGLMIASWKAHEGEILQIKAYNDKSFVTSSFDQHMNYWNYDEVKPVCSMKGLTEPVHCFSFYKDTIISATTANRVGVHAPVGPQAFYTSTKLKSDVFRGVLTTMSVLPLNRLLLLGSDNGEIRLLA